MQIGMLWGDFPWEASPPKVGKLLSTGVVARNVTRALSAVGSVVPYRPPSVKSPEAVRAALESFLRSSDVLWADVYPTRAPAIRLRHFYHRENFGLSQAEAQACGTPVVCTAWGGFKDVVRHGETGYTMDAILTKHSVRVDWATGARHVVRLLTDPELQARMSERAAEAA